MSLRDCPLFMRNLKIAGEKLHEKLKAEGVSNLGVAIFTNHHLLVLHWRKIKYPVEESILRLRKFYADHKETLDTIGNSPGWFDRHLILALEEFRRKYEDQSQV